MTAFEDRFEIRELIDRWSYAVNERDWEALGTCFTEDGVWDVGQPSGLLIEGNKAIVDNVPGLIETQQYLIQTASAVVITLNGDTATARSAIHEMMRGHDGSGIQLWATYYDDLVRTSAGWRFKLRKFRIAVLLPEPVQGEFLRSYGEVV